MNAPGVRSRAALLVDKGQVDEAINLLKRDLAEHPEHEAERRLLVRLYGVKGDLRSAQQQAEQLVDQLGLQSPVPWIELGHAYELSHRYDDALAFYDRAAEVAPKDPAGPREGGMRAARWGEAELAEPRLVQALRRDPRDAKLWHALGVVRLRLKNLPGARVAYTSGLSADPSALENRVGLATVALLDNQPRQALAQYDQILNARPRFADAHLGRSFALIQLGRLDDAEIALADGEKVGANPRVVARQKRLILRLRGGSQVKQNR